MLAKLLLPYRVQVEAVWAGRRASSRADGPEVALVDIPTVAARLSCSRGHVYNLIARGELDRRDIGTRGAGRPKTRVVSTSVDAYIARGQRLPVKG